MLNCIDYFTFFTLAVIIWTVGPTNGLYFTTNCPQSYTCDITQGIFTIKCVSCTTQLGSSILALPVKSNTPELNLTLSIIAKNNLLQRLPTNLCLYASQLRILDLSTNAISDPLTPSYFNCLVNVETLNISNNFIHTIEANAFDALINLRTLDLSFNEIVSLPNYLFVLKLPALQSLQLQNNLLTEIDVWFFYLNSINYINLSNNKITGFKSRIGWTPRNTTTSQQLLGSTSTIDMSMNRMTKFDDDILNEYRICSSTDLSYFLKLMYTVNFNNNNFDCTCDSYNMLMFYQTLNENFITTDAKIFKTYCSTPAAYFSSSIFSFKDSNECVGISKYSPIVYETCVNAVSVIVSALDASALDAFASMSDPPVNRALTSAQIAGIVIGFLGLFFLLFGLVYCLCPIEILACLFDCWPILYSICPCKSNALTNKYYDVFVSYNRSSEKWIKNQLVPFFQTERPNDRYYLQHSIDNPDKHGKFGAYTKEKMNNSAIILLVLSDSYLIKEWKNEAFRDHLRLLLTKPHKNKYDKVRFVAIQLHDVSDEEVDDHIRSKLQLPQFISLETDEFFFWKKLEYFLYLNRDEHQIVTPVHKQPQLTASSDDSTLIEETGVVNEQFLLDEYTTSLEQIVYENQQPDNEVIQNIKYDHLNKKFTIKIGGEQNESLNQSSIQEYEERQSKTYESQRSTKKHHSRHSKNHRKQELREEETQPDVNLNQKILNESLKYYRSINRTPRRKEEEMIENSSSRTKRASSDQNQILKCADPKNMVMF